MDGGEEQQPAESNNPETQEGTEQQNTEPTQQTTENQPENEQPTEQQASEEDTTQQEDSSVKQEEEKKEDTDKQEDVTEQKPAESTGQEQADAGEQKPSESEEQKPADASGTEEQKQEESTEQKPAETSQQVEKPPETEATAAEGQEQEKAEVEGKDKTDGAQKPDEGEQQQAEGEQQQAEGEQQKAEGEQQKTEGEQQQADGEQQQATEGKEETDGAQKPEEGGEQKPAEGQEVTEGGQKPEEAAKQKVEGQQEEQKEAKEESTEQKPAETTQQAEEGGEGEEGDEEQEKKEEEPKIPDDFYYEYENFASRPTITAESGLPEDLLTLQHSFGYDCTKRGNLHLLNEKTVVFAAGNLVQIVDLLTKEQTFIRSTSGGGIGAITVHPSKNFFAVAEKGQGPNINIFEWPSLKLYRVLRGGTERSYSFIDFNPDGTLLATQGGDPDFMLTVWDWKQEKTVLRSKAFSQDVFRATFSTELDGQLTTSGTVHIKFWKMADTFTGLKLQGELGKFGRTEITDIEGYVELPDGKVLSGSEWGNMLLWEGGLIKVEIRMKNKKSCHTGAIQQILLDEGELMSVGIDGYIRVWDFEAIDTADTTDETGMFELDPMNELKVGNDVQLKSIIKSVDSENEPTIWYAQDANGGIWKLDLSFSHTSMAPEKMFTYHAGTINACDVSPVSQLVATTGADHTVRVFDYVQQKQICDTRFAAGGTSLVWIPNIIDPKGGSVIVGFEDGVVRALAIGKIDEESTRRKKHHELSMELLQAFKPHSKAVTSIAMALAEKFFASGSSDGTVFFMNIGKTYEPIGFTKVAGPVTKVQWSPDKFNKGKSACNFLKRGWVKRRKVGPMERGNLIKAHSFEIKGLKSRIFKFQSIKSRLRKLDETNLPDDIEDPKAYSIEEAKQKAEHDKMMKEAEEKKREVRRHVAKMRRMFKQLLEQNDSLPKHLRLHKDEFEMDREIKLELERHKTEKIDVVRKELAWESEKQRIALEKLRKRFKDVVECDRIVVKAFESAHEVASFRASKLSDDFYIKKAEFERKRTQLTKDDITRDPTRDLLTGATRITDSTGQIGEKAEDQTGAKVITTLKGSMGERITKALYKVEEKKKKRAERKAQWAELYETKPDDDYEDPADISAIKEAKDNMGDYKLKTANDYVVPDHLRMNVDKARGRLLVLKDLIHENKYEFNQRLLAMRDKKIQTIEEIKDLITELELVHSKMEASLIKPVPPVPVMHPDEMPEKKLEYTRETLVAFKKEMAEKASSKKGNQESGGFGGFGGFGGGAAPDKKSELRSSSPTMTHKQSTTVSTARAVDDTDANMEGEEEELSPLEAQMKQAEVIRLTYEQDRLLNRINELLKNFDAELRLLRHDKFRLDITMKNADLRQVTLFEELVLLKEYEKREDVLAEKVTNKQQEKLDMQAKIVDVTSKLEVKKKDIEKLQEREKALHAQFVASLGENNKFGDYLTKVFKKRIKRSKKKATEGDDDDEDSDEDSDDDSDWDEDEDDDESETGGYDLDICPPGCDQNLYEATCQLREKRLDIEEALVEEKKTNDTLKKELDSFHKKSKVIDNGLKTAQQDLEAFQLEKQQKLNELDVVVSLKLHQIQYMINGILPQDLGQTLVFESNGVTRLQLRIKELEHEKHSQKKYMRESKKKHVQLIKDRKIFEAKMTEMETDCEEMMVSKFGCVVDIEKLETVTVNRNIEELKEKLRMTEIQCAEEVTEWNELISEKKNQITDLIRENTKRLNQLSNLLNNKHGSEGALDSRQKNLGEEYSGARKADVREKQRLIQLVQLQAQEIDALKEEIMLLSRKGGHILPPAQPPLPQSPNMRTLSN
ncbi:LOW QUALITY PROTEIN: cilia- and flagella-associated protein 44-like [Ruditapes philippinarum]|uniref:LOW QUALITY PROTEIN: cilia- and flagella-associated protein 44-like n=1 Tax=Ruditapes philippinarum TaxID=129788 RepID=UPI00295BA6CA|nr:LOW QUALITY PROTEIN: cilia- and flagella-associated protein 44-like [Ruditapes philippinarum]